MAKLTDALAAKLDRNILDGFADIYLLEGVLASIAKNHDLDDPDVIAAIATCADVASAQQRLIGRPPAALAKGLAKVLERGDLRETAELMVHALFEGATIESAAAAITPTKKGVPAFARASRLPAPTTKKGKRADAAQIEELVGRIAVAKLGDPPEADYKPESLADLARALALGWLSHGADPKHKWAAFAAAHFPSPPIARELGMMARELGPRVGQFSKAQILVDVLAAMNTREALEELHALATKVKTRSVRDRAKAAFDAAAKRAGTSQHDLADKLISDDAPVGKDFTKRLEQRMVSGATMPALEFFENILQRKAVRERARGVIFGAKIKSKLVTFTIGGDDELVGIDGKPITIPPTANVLVAHPLDVSLAKWHDRIDNAPFQQIDRAAPKLADARALAKHAKSALLDRDIKQGAFYGLENLGWKRAGIIGGTFSRLERELAGITAAVDFEPGIYAGRGMGASPQQITAITARGSGPARALGEIARELATLAR